MASNKENRKSLFDTLFWNLTQTIEFPQDVESICSQISLESDVQEDIESSLDLLISLKMTKRLSSDNMDDALELFINCRLFRAANLVKEYIDQTGIESNFEYQRVEIDDDGVQLCTMHKKSLELLCNNCNNIICYRCAFHDHREHVLTSAKEVDEREKESSSSLRKNLSTLNDILKDVEIYVEKRTTLFSGENQKSLKQHLLIWEDLIVEQEEVVYEKLNQQNHKEKEEIQAIDKTIASLKEQLEAVDGRICEPINMENQIQHLRSLKQCQDSIQMIKERMKEEKSALNIYGHICTFCLPLSERGNFVDFQIGTVVGAISVTKQAAVVVRDERLVGGSVTLSCVSSENNGLFWKHDVTELNHPYPIALSGSLYVSGGQQKILIACGETLLVVTIAQEGPLCTIQESETKMVKIPKCSYITSISPITAGNSDTGILLAVNTSTELLRLDRKLELFDTLNCSEFVHSIASLACVETDVLLLDSARNDVLLVNDDKVMTLSCRLSPPCGFSSLCRAKVAQWDGSFWGIIWESTGRGKIKWQHSIYLRNGTEFHSGVSGICRDNTVVSSISFMKDQSLVCFSNGEVKVFSTNII